MLAKSLSHVFVTLQTVAPLSVGFSRQEYRSGLLCPPPGVLPDPGFEPVTLTSPALASGFFTTSPTWEAWTLSIWNQMVCTFWVCFFSLDIMILRFFFTLWYVPGVSSFLSLRSIPLYEYTTTFRIHSQRWTFRLSLIFSMIHKAFRKVRVQDLLACALISLV